MKGTLLQVCSTEEDESKGIMGIIVSGSSTEEIESEFVHKNINKEKDAKNETDYEELSVTYDPVFNEPGYFNIFNCGQNLLKNLTRRTNKRTWPPQETNTIQKCMRLYLTTMTVTMHHCTMIIFDK